MIEGCIYIEGRYVHKFSILPKQIYLATRDINYLSFMMAANGFIIGPLYAELLIVNLRILDL